MIAFRKCKACLQEILPYAEPSEIEEALKCIDNRQINVVQPPVTGLLMLTALDCFGTPFHLGEVLVTEAVVQVGDGRGQGRIVGDAPGAALLLACVEALAAAETPLPPEIDCLRQRWEKRRAEALRRERELVAATRVAFESMAEG